MKQLRVGFVLDDSLDKSDGVQQYVLIIGSWLRNQGHRVSYLVGETARDDIDNIYSLSRNVGVRFNQNRMSTPLLANKKQIKSVLDTEKFDILHVQMPYSPMLAGRVIAAAHSMTAIVGTFHIVPFSGLERLGSKILAFWLRKNLRRFDCVLSVSRPAQDFARKSFGLTSEVLPNVINYAALSKSLPIPKYNDGRFTIVFLGRLVERKGCRQLFDAVAVLKEHTTRQIRVLVCGTGPQEQELRMYAHALGLDEIVEFCGYLEETTKGDYLASADVAVFPSLGGESFGIVLIEAMAAGAGVVIGGDNLGYRSVLDPWPECLVNPLKPQLFAYCLLKILLDKPLQERLHDAQQQAVQNYDVAVIGKKLIHQYETTIAKKH